MPARQGQSRGERNSPDPGTPALYGPGVETRRHSRSSHWASEQWRAEAVAWIESVTAARGITILSQPKQIRIRPWSTQLTVDTNAGVLWFKENCPSQAFEARVAQAIADLAPEHVVSPLAVQENRGWMLTPDGGPTLRESQSGDDLDVWVQVVSEWADLQLRLCDHTDRLLGAGVTMMPPDHAASYLLRRAQERAELPGDHPGHLTPEKAGKLRELAPAVTRWAQRLDATGLPLALDHNDLHSGNAFRPRPGERRLRFFDFGDAVLAHPFCSLLVPLRALTEGFATGLSDPRIQRVIDAYLRVWRGLADEATLRGAIEPAIRLACLNRSESWRRVLLDTNAVETAQYGDPSTYWLTAIADPV